MMWFSLWCILQPSLDSSTLTRTILMFTQLLSLPLQAVLWLQTHSRWHGNHNASAGSK